MIDVACLMSSLPILGWSRDLAFGKHVKLLVRKSFRDENNLKTSHWDDVHYCNKLSEHFARAFENELSQHLKILPPSRACFVLANS